MKESRRKFVKTVGTMSIVGAGFTGVGSAKKGSPKSNLHPEDKDLISKQLWQNADEMRRFYTNSPLYNIARKNDGILVYIDTRAVRENLDYIEVSKTSEKSISRQIGESSHVQKAKEQGMTEQEVDEKIDQQITQAFKSDDTITTDGISTMSHNGDWVYIGNDETFYSCDYGGSGTAGLFGNKASDSNTSNDHMQAEIVQAPSPYIGGNAWATAWLADDFRCYGGGEEFAEFSSKVYYDGYLWSSAWASSEMKITFELENKDDGSTHSDTHLDASISEFFHGGNYYDSTDYESETVLLKSGVEYRAKVKIKAKTTVSTLQAASVDFGSLIDGSSPGRHVDANFFEIDFAN
jgi:hypothetical protein